MLHVSTKSYLGGVVCAALLFLCPATVAAIPLSEYHQNLKNAIAALDKLNESVEAESTDDYQKRFNQTLGCPQVIDVVLERVRQPPGIANKGGELQLP